MWLTSTCLPPARCTAISIARLTSVPTSVRLYSAEPRISDWGSAAARALSTAAEIAFSVIRCPRNAVSASFDLIGVNPTQPSTIADLYVGNARCAVVKNWELRSTGRRLDLRVPSQGAKSQGAVFFLDVRRPGDEIQIHKMLWAGEAQLHQRDQALASCEQLGFFAELQEHSGSFLQRGGTVIVESSWIHCRS